MSEILPWVKFVSTSQNEGVFVVSPLDPGMGSTVGNAIRRVLISSLSGAAVTFVKIDGVSHEFSSIPNVVEDVLSIISNLKGVVFKYDGDEPVTLSLSGSGEGCLLASDIDTSGALVEIVNPNHHILQLSAKAKVDLKIIVEKGKGYRPALINNPGYVGVDYISVDSSFSPVLRANYSIESVRVGKNLDYDSLQLNVVVNGSVSVEHAMNQTVNILSNLFSLFNDLNKQPVPLSEDIASNVEESESFLNLSIDDIELSARSSNCLKRAGIATVGELVSTPISTLFEIKNFGQKSADEINKTLSDYNLSLNS